MKIKSTLTAALAAVLMTGTAATAAQATTYDLTGGNYASASVSMEFTTYSGYMACSSVTVAGDTENVSGAPGSTEFLPTFSSCREFVNNPMLATAPQPWKLTVLAQTSPGVYSARIDVQGGTLVNFAYRFPNAVYKCQATYTTQPGGMLGTVTETPAGLVWTAWGTGNGKMNYALSGCYDQGSGEGRLLVGGSSLTLPGVGVDEL